MTLVVDASVAVKWVMPENGAEAAARLQREELLAAPDFLIVECANALRIKARRREIRPEEAKAGLVAIQSTPIQLFNSSDYAAAAQTLAFELDQTVYDSLYLAVALARSAVLVTADRSFVQGVTQRGAYSHAVKLLGTA